MSVYNSEHGDDYIEDTDPVTLISKLDISDSLHLHPNDSTALTVVSVKLKGIENYQVWSCDTLLALEEKNKTSFIDGSFKRSNTDDVLGRLYDKAWSPYRTCSKVLKESLQIDNKDENVCCEICQKDKQIRERFSLSDHTLKFLGDLVHLDLWRSYKVTTYEEFRYFLTVVDDYTRVVWVYLIKSKDDVLHFITVFYNLIENQFKRKIKVFRSDNGTEFINQTVNKLCDDKGFINQTSCAYTPQQNEIAERKHRHLLNVARSHLFQGRIPLRMWTEYTNHINFSDREYPEMPNDDERVNPNLSSDNKSQSDSSHSSVSGEGVNTADFPKNFENDVDSSDNIFAT
nr:ribonuclease H-like domain-containing protein [Tanacetum cinerariifolium]